MVTTIIRACKKRPLVGHALRSLDMIALGGNTTVPSLPGECTSDADRELIASNHAFESGADDHDECIRRYWGTKHQLVVPWTAIEEKIGTPENPLADFIYFKVTSSRMEWHAGVGNYPEDYIDYSSCLLWGIHARDGNTHFTFSIAYDFLKYHDVTVAINTGKPGGYYDFSNEHP